jgi:putative transposase
MKIPSKLFRLKGFRFLREITAYAVWVCYRFAPSTADGEDLLAERGVTVSPETIRQWVNRFGSDFAHCIRQDRPTVVDKWHLDKVVIPINGRKCWLWRITDANGDTLDILAQPRRNTKAARRFLKRLISQFGEHGFVITPCRDIATQCIVGQWINCEAISGRSAILQQMRITGHTTG